MVKGPDKTGFYNFLEVVFMKVFVFLVSNMLFFGGHGKERNVMNLLIIL